MSYCKTCFNDNKGPEICGECKRNPKNVFIRDHYQDYPIHCKFGIMDCIHDPGYLWRFHHEWYIELYGDVDPSTVEGCEYCDDGSEYDDEDK
jgi:hypothetical protein